MIDSEQDISGVSGVPRRERMDDTGDRVTLTVPGNNKSAPFTVAVPAHLSTVEAGERDTFHRSMVAATYRRAIKRTNQALDEDPTVDPSEMPETEASGPDDLREMVLARLEGIFGAVTDQLGAYQEYGTPPDRTDITLTDTATPDVVGKMAYHLISAAAERIDAEIIEIDGIIGNEDQGRSVRILFTPIYRTDRHVVCLKNQDVEGGDDGKQSRASNPLASDRETSSLVILISNRFDEFRQRAGEAT